MFLEKFPDEFILTQKMEMPDNVFKWWFDDSEHDYTLAGYTDVKFANVGYPSLHYDNKFWAVCHHITATGHIRVFYGDLGDRSSCVNHFSTNLLGQLREERYEFVILKFGTLKLQKK